MSLFLLRLARVLPYTVGNKWHMTSRNMHEMHITSWRLGMTLLPATSSCYLLLVFASFWLMCSESGNDYMTDLARVHVARRQWRNTELWDPLQWGCPKKSNGDDMTTWVSVGAHYIDLAIEKANDVQQWRLGEALEAIDFINLVGRWHFGANGLFSGARC